MKKRVLWILLGLGLLAASFVMLYEIQMAPGANERLHNVVQDTPAGIFYPVVIGCMAFGLAAVLFALLGGKKWAARSEKISAQNAKKVASSLWYAENPMVIEGCPVIGFRHFSFSRQHFTLPVRPGHPDVEKFLALKHGDTVEFEPLEKGMGVRLSTNSADFFVSNPYHKNQALDRIALWCFLVLNINSTR